MNKKEEIKRLKLQNKCLESSLRLSTEVLEPVQKQSAQRGARMQLLMEYIKSINPTVFGLVYPKEFDEWFDIDGVPLK